MRITDSNIVLGSSRDYQSLGRSRSQTTAAGSFAGVAGTLYAKQKDTYYSREDFSGSAYSYTSTGSGYSYDGITGRKDMDATGVTNNILTSDEQPTPMQMDLLKLLLKRITGASASMSMPIQQKNSDMIFQSSPTTMTERVISYQEQENTRFAAQGVARTEDGREIDFQVALELSRSYMEYMDFKIPMLAASLADPLVVNIGSDIAQVTDQTFRFDLDADGVEEEVAMLGKGSGFLALDLNEDGKINDGSELFGTRSGDGFEDLRRFDSDGNGWIDENDSIFEKLKVWCKNADGTDVLMNLKEADIGAIFLGEAKTEFSIYGNEGMQNGQLRSTGIFLKESGGVGTVQHVDLATYDSEQLQQVRMEQMQQSSKVDNGDKEQLLQRIIFNHQENRKRERNEQHQEADYKSVQKKVRLERNRMAEAIAKKRAEQKRIARELADKQFAKRQKLEDARLEKLFEEREQREEFFTKKDSLQNFYKLV